MVRQGEEHAAADLLIKERIEAVNQGKLFKKKIINNFRYRRHILKATLQVELHLIFEKSISKNGVSRNPFLVYFELEFYCLCSLQNSSSK